MTRARHPAADPAPATSSVPALPEPQAEAVPAAPHETHESRVSSPPKPLVVLIGAPGAGKTSVAEKLAGLLGASVRDTDAAVEATAGRAIADIFVTDGEPRFRAWERDAVAEGLGQDGVILSLGGGAVLDPLTRERLRGHRVVHLLVSMPQGVRRTGLASNRPLLAGVNPRATYQALLQTRLPIYREVATLEVDTDHRSVAEVAQVIAEWLRDTNE